MIFMKLAKNQSDLIVLGVQRGRVEARLQANAQAIRHNHDAHSLAAGGERI